MTKEESQLTNQELNQIRAEAERLYPDIKNPDGKFKTYDQYVRAAGEQFVRQETHIAAATLYQERIKGLLEALEDIKNQKMERGETNIEYAFNRNWHIATDALTNYNESLKG